MSTRNRSVIIIALLTVLSFVTKTVQAASYTWDGGGANGSWATAGNWVGDVLPTFNNQSEVIFNTSGAGNVTNYINSNRTINKLTFNDDADSNLDIIIRAGITNGSGRSLTFDGTNAGIAVSSGAAGSINLGIGGDNLVLSTNIVVNHNGSGILSFTRSVIGAYGITKEGSGQLTLAGPSATFDSLTMNAGSLTLASSSGTINSTINSLTMNAGSLYLASSLSTINSMTMNAGSVYLTKSGQTFNSLTMNDGSLTLSASGKFNNLTINGGTALVDVNNVIDDTDRVTIGSQGTLSFVSGGGRSDTIGSLAGSGNVILKNPNDAVAAIAFGGDNTDTEFSGVISSVQTFMGSVEKQGTGTMTLSGDNTYKMRTLVSAGSLIINGNQTAATNVTTVAAGAALGGDGIVGGSIVFQDDAKFLFDAAATLTAKGTTVDLGDLSVAELIGLDNSVEAGVYTLIDGTAVMDFSSVQNLGALNAADLGDGKSAYFDDGSSTVLRLIVIPEPATIGMLGLGAVIALVIRRHTSRR